VPVRSPKVTRIHIKKSGTIRADHTVSGKYKILEDFAKGDLLLAAWTGQYRTDIFNLDIKEVRKQLK
jgi:hypothetical protein